VERTTIAGETDELRQNLPQRHYVPPQIPHDQVWFQTPDRSGGKPATNRLSYGAATVFVTVVNKYFVTLSKHICSFATHLSTHTFQYVANSYIATDALHITTHYSEVYDKKVKRHTNYSLSLQMKGNTQDS
jgi:hypothetical protein